MLTGVHNRWILYTQKKVNSDLKLVENFR